jgi:hypothetical protein
MVACPSGKYIFTVFRSDLKSKILQEKIPKHAAVAPIIIATDKTQLTQFSGNKAAYPVYLTIGNLPKSIWRKPSQQGCILLGYLSVEKIRQKNMTDIDYRSRIQRLFHESMKIILEPLKEAGEKGIKIRNSQGEIRQVHPFLCYYVADYPEQCLVSCTKYSTCPKCRQKAENLESVLKAGARTSQWTKSVILEAKETALDSFSAFHSACMDKDVARGTYDPFWSNLPFTDIHKAITPDILHQLYQGVFKHLIGWCQSIVGEKELDRRIRCLPYGRGLRRFKNGISALSQISGSEQKNMAKILLGCIQDVDDANRPLYA